MTNNPIWRNKGPAIAITFLYFPLLTALGFAFPPSSIGGIVGTSTTLALITGFLLGMTALAGIRQNQEWFHISVASLVLTLLVSLATILAGQNADNGFSFSVGLGLRVLFGFNVLFFAAATAGYAFSLLTRKETV